MKYWIVTDTHFGHASMIKYCDRPEDFSDRMLDGIRRTVKEDDILVHLGDVCIGNDADWHGRLMDACRARSMWLVLGNHDRKTLSWYFDAGWDSVGSELVLPIHGEVVIFSHKPVARRGEYINIHGHLHNTGHHPECPLDHRNLLVMMEHHYNPQCLRKLVEGHQRKRKDYAETED